MNIAPLYQLCDDAEVGTPAGTADDQEVVSDEGNHPTPEALEEKALYGQLSADADSSAGGSELDEQRIAQAIATVCSKRSPSASAHFGAFFRASLVMPKLLEQCWQEHLLAHPGSLEKPDSVLS